MDQILLFYNNFGILDAIFIFPHYAIFQQLCMLDKANKSN